MSTVSGISNTSNKLRITGMATGMDTDTTIKQMMKAYYTRVDKVKQQQQILQWKQDAYRDFMGQINTFKSKYFDVLSKDYILSGKNISTYDVSTTDTSNAVKMTAESGVMQGSYSIKVNNIATKASTVSIAPNINIDEAAGSLTFPVKLDGTNNEITVDGKTNSKITLAAGTYTSLSSVATAINAKLASTVDEGNPSQKLSDSIKAVIKDDTIKFYHKVKIDDTNHDLKVTVGGKDYNITVANGNYTMEDLSAQLNSKLSGATATDGITKFPTGFKAQSTDGLNITFVDSNNNPVAGNVNYADNTAVSTTAVSLDSTGIGANSATLSNPSVSGNTLSYDEKIIAGVNDTLNVKIFDGTSTTTKTVILNPQAFSWDSATSEFKDGSNNNAIDTIASQITTQLSGTGITASKAADGKLMFESNTKSQITITGDATGTLGLSSTFTIDQNVNDKMSNLISGEVKFTVNGSTFHYNFDSDTDVTNGTDITVGAKNKSIDDIIRDVEGKAGVDISYSQLTRQFVMTSLQTGSSQSLTASDTTGSFLNTIFGASSISQTGSDATVEITTPNGTNTVKQPTNNFTIDGISYALNAATTSSISFSVNSNVDKGFDSIKGFIDSYNDLITKIGNKVEEKKQYTYLPLTDDEKSSMSEDQITKWEDKAKQGLLSGDSSLENMLLKMRTAFFDEVKDSGINLFDIGLNTSSDVSQRGKIIIDEDKLKAALKDNRDKVMDLFIQKSTSHSTYSRTLNSTDRAERYKEEGIFNRLSDIVEDNVSTFRDSNGKKGTLLEIAGIKGDFTEYRNYLTDQIKEKESSVSDMLTKIYDREDRYYKQFAELETAMNKLNSQSSWLMSQLGMSSQG